MPDDVVLQARTVLGQLPSAGGVQTAEVTVSWWMCLFVFFVVYGVLNLIGNELWQLLSGPLLCERVASAV